MTSFELPTAHGPARVHLDPADGARAALVLGHGAGGSVGAPDLAAAREAALGEGLAVALVEQPYRVAGRRSSPPAPKLDDAWRTVLERLRGEQLAGLALIAGGRSAGARVACRTAEACGAAAVLCLAFPLQPPRRRSGAQGPSRIGELDAVRVPTLVVQGERDRFGIPPARAGRKVVLVPGDHGLKRDLDAVRSAVASWLAEVLGSPEAGV